MKPSFTKSIFCGISFYFSLFHRIFDTFSIFILRQIRKMSVPVITGISVIVFAGI